jgi:hypothetical protein
MRGYKSLGFKNIFQGFSEEKRHCCFSWNRATYQIWFTLSLVENSKTFLVMCDTCHSAHKTKMSLNNTEKTTTKNNNPMSIKIDLVGMVFKWILSRATPNMSGKGAARDPRVQWTVSILLSSPKVSVVVSSCHRWCRLSWAVGSWTNDELIHVRENSPLPLRIR